MRVFSLRALLMGTAVVALCLVILGRPSLFWMRVAFSGTLLTLAWWIVLALAGQGAVRRFGIAAAVIGVGYLTIGLRPSEREHAHVGSYVAGRMLLTHQLLEGAAKLLGQRHPASVSQLSLWDSEVFNEWTVVSTSPSGGGRWGITQTVPGSPPMARYQQYLISGHCLFAILFGWIAGCAARGWLRPDGAGEGGSGENGGGGPR